MGEFGGFHVWRLLEDAHVFADLLRAQIWREAHEAIFEGVCASAVLTDFTIAPLHSSISCVAARPLPTARMNAS